MLKPPMGIAPDRLWRDLLAVPRLVAPVAYRLRDASSVEFTVRALTSLDLGDAATASDAAPEEIRNSRFQCEVISLALLVGGERAFDSAEAVGALSDREIAGLSGDVFAALARISPTYAKSDVDAWMDVLVAGAKHRANALQAFALGDCVDVAVGMAGVVKTPRPDRYFGLPTRELTDGHWLAFRAAQKVVKAYSSG